MVRSCLVGLFAAAVCAGAASAQQRQPDGPTPPADYDQVARADIAKQLKDPSSAVIELVRPAAWASFQGDLGEPVNGWTACYSVNAKNSYGGYTGAQRWVYVFEDGQLTYSVRVDPRSRVFAERVERECSQAAPAVPASPKAAEVSL